MSSAADRVDLDEVRAAVLGVIGDLDEGEPLDSLSRALIEYGVRMCMSCLDVDGATDWAQRALDAGATADQLAEILLFVSGVGTHALIEGSRALAGVLQSRGEAVPERDGARQELWDRYRAGGSYWTTFETHVPGFLDALLRLYPDGFAAFMEFGAAPARTGHVDLLVKEFIAIAADATPTHRYLPGLRAHLDNAIRLGVGRTAVLEVLDIAAAAPAHRGVR
jgi:alkylhydroperoxidase/carboxymuconolactone decarboxylase family protein YurZ